MSLRTLQSKDPPESLLCSECPAEVPDLVFGEVLQHLATCLAAVAAARQTARAEPSEG